MQEFPVFTDIPVRFRDTDAMGHVNNAVYLTYLEVGRQAYWERLVEGLDQDRGYENVPFVLAHASIDFRLPTTTDSVVRVHLRTHWMSRSSYGMCYVLTEKGSGRVVAEAETVQVTYDYAAGRSMPVPAWLRQRTEVLEGRPLPQQPPGR